MNSTPDTLKNGERLVVTENTVRVSGQVHATPEAAQQEMAARRKQLQEQHGRGAPTVETKQQLFG